MMRDLKQADLDTLFKGNEEQPGSQMAYVRDLEIKRRLFVSHLEVAEAQIKSAKAQAEAAVATKNNSKWTMFSAIGILLTAIVTMLGPIGVFGP